MKQLGELFSFLLIPLRPRFYRVFKGGSRILEYLFQITIALNDPSFADDIEFI